MSPISNPKKKPQATRRAFGDIHVGDEYSFNRTITAEDTSIFADLTGNYNPLHTNQEYGKKSPFGSTIAFGMMAASLFSTLIGMHCPGEKSLCLSQTLLFNKPIFHNDTVTVRGTILHKNETLHVITLKTEITREEEVVITGEAKVKLL
jgi:3-hydroxybutyryl-CoA dehydratase